MFHQDIPTVTGLVPLQGIRAYLAILPRGLYYRNLSLLEGPFYLYATAFCKVSVEFLFRLSRDFKGGY